MSMDPNQQYGQQQPPQQPYGQPQTFAATAGRWGVSALGNLGAEVMAGLAYLVSLLWVVGLIGQIILFAMEKNRYVKFHAAQAMVLSVVEFLLGVVYIIVNVAFGIGSNATNGSLAVGGISLLVNCVLGLVSLALFGFWIWGMIAAFTGKPTKLPIIGNIAEQLAGGPVTAV